MPTTVGILTIMSRRNSTLGLPEKADFCPSSFIVMAFKISCSSFSGVRAACILQLYGFEFQFEPPIKQRRDVSNKENECDSRKCTSIPIFF